MRRDESPFSRYCEARSDEAIQQRLDRHALLRGLAMTAGGMSPGRVPFHHALADAGSASLAAGTALHHHRASPTALELRRAISRPDRRRRAARSEEHTSELRSLMRLHYGG